MLCEICFEMGRHSEFLLLLFVFFKMTSNVVGENQNTSMGDI